MFSGRPIKAIIFDLDDTLVHCMADFTDIKLWVRKELKAYNAPMSIIDTTEALAANMIRVRGFMIEHGNEKELDELENEIRAKINEAEMEHVKQTTQIIGSAKALELVKEKGLKVGLLTRGSRRYAKEALRCSCLSYDFDAMICRTDYPENEAKPNPIALERIAEQLGVSPSECMLIGDHLFDMDCAFAASALFVGVTTGGMDEIGWSRLGCNSVITSIADIKKLLSAFDDTKEERT